MSVFGHRSILVLLVVFGWLVPQVGHAETKVGFVDTQKVVSSSKEAKAAEDKLNALLEKKREQFKPQQEQFAKLRQELETQLSVLSPEALDERQIELTQLKNQIERDVQAAEEEVQIERRKALAPLLRKIQDVINEIGKQEGFSIIMERHVGVIYFSDSLDITDKVIEQLNQKG